MCLFPTTSSASCLFFFTNHSYNVLSLSLTDVAFALESAIEPLIEQMNIEEAAKVGMKMISEAEIKGQLKDEHLDAFTAVMALKGNKFVITS